MSVCLKLESLEQRELQLRKCSLTYLPLSDCSALLVPQFLQLCCRCQRIIALDGLMVLHRYLSKISLFIRENFLKVNYFVN